jgi:hypothetical protein
MSTTGPLPPLYARWMAEALSGPIPDETRAECSDCNMTRRPDREPPPVQPFASDTKCCTYQPELHNFLVGAILADTDKGVAWAKEVIAMRMQRRTGVTPVGIRAEPFKQLVYERIVDQSPAAFGRLREIRCPYYLNHDGGRCGVWRHRNSICTTWFCRYERGIVGRVFWKQLLALLRTVEQAVSSWAMLELGIGDDAAAALAQLAQRHEGTVQDAIDQIPDRLYRRLWGPWFGREAELYKEAARRVHELAWTDVQRIAGPYLKTVEVVVRRAYAELVSTDLPAQVTRAPDVLYQIHPRKPAYVRITARPLPYDPLDLPAAVLDRLPSPGVRAPCTVVEDDATLRRLLDYGVLQPVREEP